MYNLAKQAVNVLVFLEAAELVLLSYFFNPVRQLLNVQSRESSQSNVYVISLLIGNEKKILRKF